MQGRPPTRAIGRKQPSDHPRATCADRRRSTVAPTSRATASPRTPQPRHHANALIEARQRMCGSLVDSKKRSRNALPKSMEHGQHGMRHRHATGALAVAGQRSEAAVRRQRRQQPRSVRWAREVCRVRGQGVTVRQQVWQQQQQVWQEHAKSRGVEGEEFESASAPAPSSTRRLLARWYYLPPTAHGGGRVWRMAGAILRASGGPRRLGERRDTVQA